jgi:cystathionine gamma-synthase
MLIPHENKRMLTAHLQCGARPPGTSIHSVVAQLPTLDSVIRYETGCPVVTASMTTGYPRFVCHPLVARLTAWLQERVGEVDVGGHPSRRRVLPVCSRGMGDALLAYLRADGTVYDGAALLAQLGGPGGRPAAWSGDAWAVVSYAESGAVNDAAKAFAQHTGCRVSSRQAAAILAHIGGEGTAEVCDPDAAAECVTAIVRTGAGYAPLPASHVLLTNSGMGAITAVFSAVRRVWDTLTSGGDASRPAVWGCPVHPRGRHRDMWLQLGWLYLDTTQAMRKLAAAPCPTCDALDGLRPACGGLVAVLRMSDGAALGAALAALGHRLAGVVTECPSNPLLQTPDLAALSLAVDGSTRACLDCGAVGASAAAPSAACAHATCHRAVVVVDPTIAGLGNVDIMAGGWADVAVLSLTKYAAGRGDVMAGALVLCPAAPLTHLLGTALGMWQAEDGEAAVSRVPVQAPYSGDLAALAEQVPASPALVTACNAALCIVAAWLEGLQANGGGSAAEGIPAGSVRAVHWALASESSRCHEQVEQGSLPSAVAYARLSTGPRRPGSVVTIELGGTWPETESMDADEESAAHSSAQAVLSRFYDSLPIVKGPSFGTTFSLASPFAYLAHYDLVSTPHGRAELRAAGLNPYLVRLHVGSEEGAGGVIHALRHALRGQ